MVVNTHSASAGARTTREYQHRHSLELKQWRWLLEGARHDMMDFATRKLVRRARIRRNHERQVRVAAVKSRKRALQSSGDSLEQLILGGAGQEELSSLSSEDGFSNSTYSTQSTTVPSLPSLAGSQSLTAASKKNVGKASRFSTLSNQVDVLQTPAVVPGQTSANPGQLQAKETAAPLGVLGKPRRSRARVAKRSDYFDNAMSDSNTYMYKEATRTRVRGYSHSESHRQGAGHLSDSAVSEQLRRHKEEKEESGEDGLHSNQQRVRKHGRVRPQGADAKRKRARQLERLKPYNSKIETVLEEELPGSCSALKPAERRDRDKHRCVDCGCGVAATVVDDSNKKPEPNTVSEPKQKKSPLLSQTVKADPKRHLQPIIADVFPSNPPSPTLSRMVRKKTEALDISETTLQQIKEMSSHLRIVNWLWDSKQLPLKAAATGAGRKAKSLRAASPSAATSGNHDIGQPRGGEGGG